MAQFVIIKFTDALMTFLSLTKHEVANMIQYAMRILLVLSILSLVGCSVADVGNTIKASHYLNTKQYCEGIVYLNQEVVNNPESEVANYYLGRMLLANGQPNKSLPYFVAAVKFDPENTDNLFWLALNYGAIGNVSLEKKSYTKVLDKQPHHLRAGLYYGHTNLLSGQYELAIFLYNKVLKRALATAPAMYSKALSLKFLDRHKEEKKAWEEYLKRYPSGYLAIKAADYLNRLGSFTYRNHPLGARTVTLKEIKFQPGSTGA